MNIFATSECPAAAAVCLPDRHICKMPVECCQVLAVVASRWYHDYGLLPKAVEGHYQTDNVPLRHNPCTLWTAAATANARWLIEHGFSLCAEYSVRYAKQHACWATLTVADRIFPKADYRHHTEFVRVMPAELKADASIDTFEAYRRCLASKDWVATNYLRKPCRRPQFVGGTAAVSEDVTAIIGKP